MNVFYYCVHAANLGWLPWVKDGAAAGTTGLGIQIEAIDIRLHKKGEPADPDLNPAGTARNIEASTGVSYDAHIQDIGWQNGIANGAVAGTTGQGRRLEGIRVSLTEGTINGSIQYRSHIQNIGWENDWKADGALSGTTGRALRLEAVMIRLTGEAADVYDVYYRVHAENFGWLAWAKNGQEAGSSGFAYRLEALQIELVPKGLPAPGESGGHSFAYVSLPDIAYATHMQNVGWTNEVKNGDSPVSESNGLRMEAFYARLDSPGLSGSVMYRSHIQNYGWENGWHTGGEVSGTVGQALRCEAVEMKLTGDISNFVKIWYRAYVEGHGWTSWGSNGAPCGSVGMGKKIESLQIELKSTDSGAPGDTSAPLFLDNVSTLKTVSGRRAITSFGGYSMSSSAWNTLNDAVSLVTTGGHQAGFVMIDLKTGKGVAYNADERIYSASCIKGPYVCSVADMNYDIIRWNQSTVQKILFYSDNNAYLSFHRSNGTYPLDRWYQSLGINVPNVGAYADINARELGLLWIKMNDFFNSGANGAELGSWYQNPNISPIHEQLGGRYLTRSKAGWIAEAPPFCSTTDGGIVYDGDRPYIIAVVTNWGAAPGMVRPLVQALADVHDDLKNS